MTKAWAPTTAMHAFGRAIACLGLFASLVLHPGPEAHAQTSSTPITPGSASPTPLVNAASAPGVPAASPGATPASTPNGPGPLAAPSGTPAVSIVALGRSREPQAGIAIDYHLRVNLPRAVIELMQRGVPVTFVAQATVSKPRWYWRDERITRVTRVMRVAWQPLTSNWRVGQGALTQTFATLTEAIASISQTSQWLIAEPHRVEPDERYLVQFSWQLDTSQLPAPMQLGVGTVGASASDVKVESAFGVIP